MSRSAQRIVGIVVLLVLGMLSLPATAYVLDDQGTENWIIPVQLLAMAAVGAAVGAGEAVLRLSNPDLQSSVQSAQNALDSAQLSLRSQSSQTAAGRH